MSHSELHTFLAQSFEDHQLSRTERRALIAVLSEAELEPHEFNGLRNRAFELVEEVIGKPGAREALEWLHRVLKTLDAVRQQANKPAHTEALFSPGRDPLNRIVRLFDDARRCVDVCVFTITDDRISAAIVNAFKRGIALRIFSDNYKADDRGSDVYDLDRFGIDVRLDRSPAHMHHKYAIFDETILLTGSYNWTKSAAEVNQENIVVTNEADLVAPFVAHFEALWTRN